MYKYYVSTRVINYFLLLQIIHSRAAHKLTALCSTSLLVGTPVSPSIPSGLLLSPTDRASTVAPSNTAPAIARGRWIGRERRTRGKNATPRGRNGALSTYLISNPRCST
jgi:hypothetical protein